MVSIGPKEQKGLSETNQRRPSDQESILASAIAFEWRLNIGPIKPRKKVMATTYANAPT